MDINRRIPLSAACIVAAIFACSAVPARAADAAWPALDRFREHDIDRPFAVVPVPGTSAKVRGERLEVRGER